MAADALTRVLGARLLGSGRVRFCRTGLEDVDVGDWVVVRGALGEEPGRVAVAPRQLVYGDPPEHLPAAPRRLTAEEVACLPALAERARGALDRAIADVRGLGAPVFLTGFRPGLDGRSATAEWRGPEGHDLAPLAAALGETGLDVRFEWQGPLAAAGEHLFGGLGRLPARPLDLGAVVRERFDLPGMARVFAPEGLPRLGSRVVTAQGRGTVRSISTRHREALVRLDSGDDVTVPVDALTPA